MKKKFIFISFAFLLLVTVITGSFFYYYSRPSASINEKIKITSFVAPIAPNAKNVLKTQLEERRTNLLALAKSDPAKFKQSVLSSEDRKTIPSDLQYLVENPIEVSGELFVAQGDNKSTQSAINIFWLKEGSKTYNLNFIEKPETIKSAELVTARGIALDREVVLESASSPNLEIRAEYRPLVTGDQKTLVIYHDFSNATIDPLITKTNVEKEMTTNANSVANFYPENSYGNVTITTTVTNKLTSAYSTDGTCHDPDIEAIITNAYTAAAAYNPDTYDRLIYLFPRITACSWAGLGQVGGINPATPTTTWINGYNESWIYSHELGHNLGAWTHAGFLDCGALAIDTISNCTNTEYGDLHDTMGWGSGHFNAAIKEGFEWLAEGNGIQTVTASGTYTINALENNTGTRALKVAKPDQPGKYYFFEFRKSIGYTGYDSWLPTGVTDGVIAHIGTDHNANTSLIDFRPDGLKGTINYNKDGDAENVSLIDGTEFYDQINNIRIIQNSHTSSSVNISISFGNLGPDAHKVTTSLALSNPTPAIGELITATYEITNTSPSPVTLSYVGVSNRLGGYYGAGYDLGWDQNITIAAGATYPVHVASAMTEPGAYSYWAAYVLNGVFYYALPQTNQMTSGTFVAHNPNIVVTNAITVNPNQPISGQSSRYSVTVTNYEPNRIYYSNIGLPANNSATGAMVDISWLSNSYIESGASLTIQQDKTFPAGRYYAWPYLNIGSKFYGIYDAGYDSRLTYFRFEVKDLQYAYPVTAPISISNPTPAIGEVVNVAYRIKNNTLSSVTFDYVGVPAMLNGNIHADIGWQQNVTVAAGASYDVVVYGIPTERGVYTHWASFVINGRFYWAVPDTTQAVFGIFPTHNPNIVVTNAITVNPNQPISGQSSRYSVTVTNYEPNRIYYSNIGLPANNSATGAMVDISWLSNSYIESGASLTIQQDKTFPAGRYYAWPYLNIGSKFYGIYDAGYDSRLTYFRFEVLNQ